VGWLDGGNKATEEKSKAGRIGNRKVFNEQSRGVPFFYRERRTRKKIAGASPTLENPQSGFQWRGQDAVFFQGPTFLSVGSLVLCSIQKRKRGINRLPL